jgi:hypothetical protein
MVLFIALSWQASGNGQPPASGKDGPARALPNVRIIVVRHAKAADVASRMRDVLGIDGNSATRIAAEESTNSLLVSGAAEMISLIELTVRSLDRSPSRGNECGARIEAVVYQLQLSNSKFASLSGDTLSASAETPQSFQAALAKLGEIRPVSMVDQYVDLSRTATLNNGSSVPFLTGTQVTKDGKVNSQIQYQDVGCKIVMEGTGAWVDRHANVQIKIETSGLHRSGIEVGNGIMAEIFTKCSMNYLGDISAGKPVVVLGVAPSAAESDFVLAYVARVVISTTH